MFCVKEKEASFH